MKEVKDSRVRLSLLPAAADQVKVEAELDFQLKPKVKPKLKFRTWTRTGAGSGTFFGQPGSHNIISEQRPVYLNEHARRDNDDDDSNKTITV